jgi:hypothetical protein
MVLLNRSDPETVMEAVSTQKPRISVGISCLKNKAIEGNEFCNASVK